jgi:membrane-bound lytic murein transglycosylase MltF
VRFSLVLALFFLGVCGKQEAVSLCGCSAQSEAKSPQKSAYIELPVNLERDTGDLDAMVKRGSVRALVLYSRSGFFYVNGRPAGTYYEALRAFEQFINEKVHAGKHLQVTFIPVLPSQLESALIQGVGDLIAYGVVVTPELEEQVAFSIPIETDVKQVVVGGKNFGAVSSVDDLAGKEIFVNPLTSYYQHLEKLNETLRSQGKLPVNIQAADKELTDEDLMEMVSAGLLPATMTFTQRANLWSQVLGNITPYPNVVIGSEGDMAWAMRKENPKLKQLVDEFFRTHAAGTSFGNTLIRRYLQSARPLKNATSESEIKKFNETVGFFRTYASEYNFDYLMIVAQGYEESMLQQSAKSRRGAVGIMQVRPKIAAAPPISIPNVMTLENNIHAGVKMLREIADKYFSDPQIDPMNRLLLTLAAYNAGPSRIAELRREAPAQGLDPNQWFGNIELLAAQKVGLVNVQYVSNIYKYYVAYKLFVEQGKSLD